MNQLNLPERANTEAPDEAPVPGRPGGFGSRVRMSLFGRRERTDASLDGAYDAVRAKTVRGEQLSDSDREVVRRRHRRDAETASERAAERGALHDRTRDALDAREVMMREVRVVEQRLARLLPELKVAEAALDAAPSCGCEACRIRMRSVEAERDRRAHRPA